MSTANELLAAACTSGISCLDEMNLLRVIAQGANAGGGGGGGGGGGTLSTDGTFAANSDLLYPSQKAAKTYIDTGLAGKQNSLGFTPENVANKSTDGTFAANSDTLYPSQKAAKTYVDNAITVTAAGLFVLKAGDTMTGALRLPAGAVGVTSLGRSTDTNTGVWFPADDTIAFSTTGAERLRVLSTGEVGIGTATPEKRLHVVEAVSGGVGAALILDNAAPVADGNSTELTFLNTDGASYAGIATGRIRNVVEGANGYSSMRFFTYSAAATDAERMRIAVDGNVGIGTTAPNEILSILGARAALYNTLTSSTNYERLDFEWSGNVARIWTEKGSGGGTARDLVLGADATELLRFQTGSKLGFFGATPVVRPPAYTPSNVTTDRSYDANASTLDEIADVLGTLIADLQGLGLLQ